MFRLNPMILKIKEIDNSKKHDNIIIFTLLMVIKSNDLPANSVMQNKILNKSNQTLSINSVFLSFRGYRTFCKGW